MELTISRALNEVKLLESRIEKQITSAVFVDAFQKKAGKLARNNVEKSIFEKNALAEFDSIIDLTERRNKIKSSILISNSNTKIKIGEKQYFVIEAIERKRAINFDKLLLTKMREEFLIINKILDQNEAEVQKNLLQMIKSAVSAERIKKESDYKTLSTPFREDNILNLVDPLKLKEKIDKLDLEIDTFLNDVDFALSESNAITKIEV